MDHVGPWPCSEVIQMEHRSLTKVQEHDNTRVTKLSSLNLLPTHKLCQSANCVRISIRNYNSHSPGRSGRSPQKNVQFQANVLRGKHFQMVVVAGDVCLLGLTY